MAKDLPYFKFFVSEWNDGDITLEDYKRQGLFINICSYYWSKECNVPTKVLNKKFKELKEDVGYLICEGHLKSLDGFIRISFLDEQKQERLKTSKKNSEAGKKSAETRWGSNGKVTGVKIPLNGNVTIKRREEKKREDKSYTFIEFLEDWNKYKLKYKKQKSSLRTLDVDSKENIKQILKSGYTSEDIKKSIVGLFMQKVFPNDGDYTTDPRHLIKDGGVFLNKYIDAQENNKRNIYGKSEAL